jgi:endo-1,4-beta-D-glucanase Y
VVGNFERGPTIKFTMPKYAGFVDTGVKGTGERFKSGKKLKKKKQLNSTFANKIFGFKKQPAFTGTYKMIPTKVLDKWIIKKGIKGIRDAKGRFISRQGMKFAIAIAIYRQGLTGRGFFSQPLLQNIRSMTKEFEKALVKDIKQNLIKTKLV